MKTLTIFTPTYNRAHTLVRTYESLCRQTCNDFYWLIIDDGSTDNTCDIVDSWKKENKIRISYVYKDNGGLHTGYNKAIEIMDTELCVCIDSDDWMPENAVEIITAFWKEKGGDGFSGIIGKDYLPSGEAIGNEFPKKESVHVVEMMSKYNNRGDRKIVMRVDLLKNAYPQPSFRGEKNFNPIYLILKIDQVHPFLLLDENLCYVDYQQDGMSANIVNQYFNSPNSFIELRKLYISLNHSTFKWKIKQYVHLVADCKIARTNPFKIKSNINKIVLALIYPVGVLLYYYFLKRRSL